MLLPGAFGIGAPPFLFAAEAFDGLVGFANAELESLEMPSFDFFDGGPVENDSVAFHPRDPWPMHAREPRRGIPNVHERDRPFRTLGTAESLKGTSYSDEPGVPSFLGSPTSPRITPVSLISSLTIQFPFPVQGYHKPDLA